MNLAEATAALGKKEAENSALNDEINQLEEQKAKGLVGTLIASVRVVEEIPSNLAALFSYSLHDVEPQRLIESFANRSVDEQVYFHIASRNGVLNMQCILCETAAESEANEAGQNQIHSYNTELVLADIPEVGELIFEVAPQQIVLSETSSAFPVTFKVKVFIDDFDKKMQSKLLEREQLQEEIKDIVAQIQTARKKHSTSGSQLNKTSVKDKKGSGGKKGKSSVKGTTTKSSSKSNTPDKSGSDEAGNSMASYWNNAVSTTLVYGSYVVEQRAYILFGLAALGIHLYGDYASV